MAKRTRMYCDEEFKKLVDIKRIQHGERNSIAWTRKVAKNPELLRDKKENERKFKTPKLF